jgi:rRNA processing protein Krr1/Pno1
MSIKITPEEWVCHKDGTIRSKEDSKIICDIYKTNASRTEANAKAIAIAEVPNMIKVLEDVVSLNVLNIAQAIRNAENLLKRLKD